MMARYPGNSWQSMERFAVTKEDNSLNSFSTLNTGALWVNSLDGSHKEQDLKLCRNTFPNDIWCKALRTSQRTNDHVILTED